MKINYLVVCGLLTLLAACSQTPKQTTQPRATDPEKPLIAAGKRQSAELFTTNSACVDIIKSFEDVRLEAYTGPSGALLIGYGHKAGVKPGMKISQVEADLLLQEDLDLFEQGVARAVKVPVTENEFSALVCLAYNIGIGNLRGSTALRMLNQGKRAEAADAILMWDKVKRKVNQHQVKRRNLERALFLAQ